MSLTARDVLAIFEQYGGLLRGHFRLSSGLHSPEYWQCARVLAHPTVAERLGAALAEVCDELHANLVVGPAMGGLIIAHEVARGLRRPMLFTERQDGAMTLRRGFTVATTDRILIVEDVITTGGSALEVKALLEGLGATVVGVACIVDRSSGTSQFGVPFVSLARTDAVTYQPEACPLCKDGVPVTKPGSRPTPAA